MLSIASAAMARSASGEAHLMIPPIGLGETTIWTEAVWPEIMRQSSRITEIKYLHPDTGAEWLLCSGADGYQGDWQIKTAPNDGPTFPLGKPVGAGKFPL